MIGIVTRPILAIVILLATMLVGSAAHAAGSADSYIVIDAASGRVLNAKNPDLQLYPASMTKIMTLYLTFEALSQGRLSLRTPLQVSELAAEQAPSKLGLRPGSTVATETCIYAAVTLSANDCAMVLAENIGGSEDEFARLMTSRARSLGMMHTHYNNPNGLPDDGQITTARDMSILAEALIQRFPKYYKYFATRSFTYNGIAHANHNHLMSRYPGMDGIKTGFIRASGFNLTASAVRDKHRLIAVVFGGTSAVSRDNYMAGLLDDGFRRAAGLPTAAAMGSAFEAVGPPPEKPDDAAQSGEVEGVPLAEAGDAVEKDEGSPAAPQAIVAQPVPVPAPQPVAQVAAKPATQTAALSVPVEMLEAKQPVAKQADDKDADATVDQAAEAHVLRVPKKKQAAAVTAPSRWNVAIGTYSSRTVSDQALQKAVATLPVDMRDDVKPVSLTLKLHHNKKAYRAVLTGLTEIDAKRACSVLTHCIPVKS